MMGIPVSRGGAWELVFLEEQRHWHPAAECLCLCLWRYVLVFVLVLVLVVVGFMRYHQDHVVLCFVVSSSCLTVMVMVMMSGICTNGSHMDIYLSWRLQS